jgi:O-methyltransferase
MQRREIVIDCPSLLTQIVAHRNEAFMIDKSIADEVRRRRLTYVDKEKFDSLYECLAKVRVSQILGDFVEFGVALGGSGICLAKALTAGRRYLGFDVFGMIPPPSTADGEEVHARYNTIASGQSAGIDGDQYYGYVEDLYDVVKNNFLSFGCTVDNKQIILVRGLFHDTLPLQNEISIALAHIDCDWYESVSYCLNYVWPRLSTGGFIVVDDYTAWSGCKKATDEFVSSHKAVEPIRYSPHAVLQKRTDAVM